MTWLMHLSWLAYCGAGRVWRALAFPCGVTLKALFPDTPALSATYSLHPNRSCWLPPHPPQGVGAGGQGSRQAGRQRQTLGSKGLVRGLLGPPWLRLLVAPPRVGWRPLGSRGHRGPRLQGRWREGRKEAAESLCYNGSSNNCSSMTTRDEHLLYTRCTRLTHSPQHRIMASR